jgi:uncharacterized membrane protein YtjA (UPF0391 family)
MIWKANELLVFLALVATYWVATEIGHRLGLRIRARCDESDKTHVGSLQAALLGMLALLLGFSFAMAVSRYELRKSLVLKEANAIGTTYLRTDFLPVDQGQEARRLLRAYVDSRLEFVESGLDAAALERTHATASSLQAQLWSITGVAAAQDAKSVPTGLLIASLNDVIDVSEERRAAFDNHVPEAVLALIVAVSCGALGFIGCSSGMAGRKQRVPTITFTILSALILLVILDMDRPRNGLIQVSQDSMLRLQASLQVTAP